MTGAQTSELGISDKIWSVLVEVLRAGMVRRAKAVIVEGKGVAVKQSWRKRNVTINSSHSQRGG